MVERLARDIGEHFRIGEHHAVLQLEPPELGKVKIELRIEDGQLHVRIAAEGQESQGLIERHLPELHQALRAGQIDAGAVRVTQGEWKGAGDLAQSFSQSPQGRQESPRGLASTPSGDESMTEHLAQPAPSVDGRVSMWA
jgi:flagellar hook-length control protein FliK